jgi:hypothetical protein
MTSVDPRELASFMSSSSEDFDVGRHAKQHNQLKTTKMYKLVIWIDRHVLFCLSEILK